MIKITRFKSFQPWNYMLQKYFKWFKPVILGSKTLEAVIVFILLFYL